MTEVQPMSVLTVTCSFRSLYLICPCFFIFIHISHLFPESIWGSYLSNQLYDGMIERIRNCTGVRGWLQQSNDGSSELPGSQGKNGNITSHRVFILPKKEFQRFKNKHFSGTFLAAQWLKLCASTGKGAGSIPGHGTKIPQTMRRGQKEKKKAFYEINPEETSIM